MKQVLKYPGSKWNIAKQLVGLIPPHHSYVEPYFGSGAVLFNKSASRIETVNDLDSDVVNLFWCIRQDAEKLAKLVVATPFSRQEYEDSYNDCLKDWNKVCFKSCAEHHGTRKEVIWMNYEHNLRLSLIDDFPEVIP